MAHATTPFHQLYLLFVDTQNGTIGVGVTVKTYHEAVRQRSHLEIVTNARHRTSCRNNISEMVKELENLLSRHGISIFLLDTGNFVRYAPMHVFGAFFVDVAEAVLHRILVHPHASCQLITFEIIQ